jgi:hypothetical protein
MNASIKELDQLVVEFEVQWLRQTIKSLQNEQAIQYSVARCEQISEAWRKLQMLLKNN